MRLRAPKPHTVALLALWAVIALLALAGATGAKGGGNGASSPVCFPAAKWSGDIGDRPCLRIVRVFEDGSGWAYLQAADGSGGVRVGIDNGPQDGLR